jgi:predicted molibdopterin-dependent oxidoreductase YjgC
MMASAEEGELRGLFIIGENPMISYPDQRRVRKALQSLDFLAVMDIFPTETTDLADVVFPAASFAEKEGTFTSTERRVQLIHRAVDPPGEARPEWQVLCDLLRRLNIPANYASPADIMEEIASITPIYGGMSYERLGQDGLQWPCPSSDHPGTEILHKESFPIGLARFRPVEYGSPHELPDEDYPFLFSTGRSHYQFHTGTMTRRTSLLEREQPLPFVEINPEDAASCGIRNGQTVIVESRRGKIMMDARVTPDIPRGMLFLPFHFHEAPANCITAQALDPASKISGLKVSAARIRRAEP